MKALSILTSAALLAGSAFAQGGHPTPGSMLVFPVHRSGVSMFTVLCVTNTNTTPATPTSFGGSINAHFEYVNVTPNPANAFMPLGCTVFDRIEFLTPADTLCVLTSCHNAAAPGGQEGYVVVTAEDPNQFDTPAPGHNFLVGSEMVVNGAGTVYAINALAYDGYVRDLDGSISSAGQDVLIIDSYVALAGSQLTLINGEGGALDKNDVYFSVYNDNERALSATLRFNCWFDQPLTAISPLFAESFLASLPNDPAELDINCDGLGDLETGWATIQSRGVFKPGGQQISQDGTILGAITAGGASSIDGGRLLWATTDLQPLVLLQR
ncbi:MAG: hypothetical protein KDB80_03370 [Planctomycetes bacterium]|nr:hypothetical protein [Planctomycetota bacterium]